MQDVPGLISICPFCTDDSIKVQYFTTVLKYHPDNRKLIDRKALRQTSWSDIIYSKQLIHLNHSSKPNIK